MLGGSRTAEPFNGFSGCTCSLPSAYAGHLRRSGERIAGHRAVLARGRVREGGPPAVRGRERLLFLPCDGRRAESG